MFVRHFIDTFCGSEGASDVLVPLLRLLHETVFVDLDTDITVFE
jgi:hypothetical protein